MPGSVTGAGPDGGPPLYSPVTGLVYIFNLIVGTGALTLPAAFRDADWDRKLDNLLDDLEHSGPAPPSSNAVAIARGGGGGGGHHAQSGTTSVLSQQQSSSVSSSSYQQRSSQQSQRTASASSKFM